MSAADVLTVRPAQWPDDLVLVQDLLRDYFRFLGSDPAVPCAIREKDRESELAALSTTYARADTASMLLAQRGIRVCGCAAVSLFPGRLGAAEMKRLYVAPETQGQGAGRALVEACADWARRRGARELLLDTLPAAMPDAVRLYRSVGFLPTARYNQNSACADFYRLDLQ